MPSYKNYIRFTQFIFAFVFLVILAGSVVRTTQSGMGCPDWPHCFGKLIPPTNASQLPLDYKRYLAKQNIDTEYNPFHAWTEYINRLLTGVLGILILIHVIWSYKLFFQTQRNIFWLSFSLLLLTAFEAWLGKTVVDTNLQIIKITAHMLPALMIAAVPLIILNKLNNEERISIRPFKLITVTTFVLIIIQIILGTEVRGQIDIISKSLNYLHRERWIGQLDNVFDVHKAFAFIISIFCLYLFWRSIHFIVLQFTGGLILIFVLLTVCIGLTLAYFNMPQFAQPLHLLCSSALLMAVLNLILKLKY